MRVPDAGTAKFVEFLEEEVLEGEGESGGGSRTFRRERSLERGGGGGCGGENPEQHHESGELVGDNIGEKVGLPKAVRRSGRLKGGSAMKELSGGVVEEVEGFGEQAEEIARSEVGGGKGRRRSMRARKTRRGRAGGVADGQFEIDSERLEGFGESAVETASGETGERRSSGRSRRKTVRFDI